MKELEKNIAIDKIYSFWKWFVENANNFGSHFENKELLYALDNEVQKLGKFSWEVGPGQKKENLLVISPNGKLDLLSQTKDVINSAPILENWEFYYAKPPKYWTKYIFHYWINQDQSIKVDATDWEYVLLAYESKTFELILKAPSTIHLEVSDRLAIAEILVDGLIGEEMRIKFFECIKIVDQFGFEFQNNAGKINNFINHINAVTVGS